MKIGLISNNTHIKDIEVAIQVVNQVRKDMQSFCKFWDSTQFSQKVKNL